MALRLVAVSSELHSAFGMDFLASFPLPGAWAGASGRPPTLTISLEPEGTLDLGWSGSAGPPVWATRLDDSRAFVVEHGVGGDYRFSYDGAAEFLLSADLATLRCAPAPGSGPGWMRALLDTVLFSVALLKGLEALHASAIEREQGVVGFLGRSGSGKTSLAVEFIRRGDSLFSDDILVFDPNDPCVTVNPGPPLMNIPLACDHRTRIGTTIATIGDEAWTFVDQAVSWPRPLAALFSLRPTRGGSLAVIATDIWEIMPYALGLPHLAGRARARFGLLCHIAGAVPLYRVNVPQDASVAATADAVSRALESFTVAGACAA